MATITVNTLALTEVPSGPNSTTWNISGHTTLKPRVCIQKRHMGDPTIPQSKQTSSLKVVYGTEAADGLPMAQKISFETIVTYPIGALQADIDAAKADHELLIASTNWDDLVNRAQPLG